MSQKKRFKDTYWYRFIIITVIAMMILGSVAAVIMSNNVNNIVRYIVIGVLSAAYIGALIYTFIVYRKNN